MLKCSFSKWTLFFLGLILESNFSFGQLPIFQTGHTSQITNTVRSNNSRNGIEEIGINTENLLETNNRLKEANTKNAGLLSINNNQRANRSISRVAPCNFAGQINITKTPGCKDQISTMLISGGDSYIWTPDPLLVSTSSGTATARLNDGNIHRFFITVFENSTGCSKDTFIEIKALPLPRANFLAPDGQCLRGNSFSLASSSFVESGTISQNHWIINNTIDIYGPLATISFSSAGTYPIKLISTTDRGCIDSVTKNVKVNPNPTAGFVAPTAQCLSGNRFVFGSSTSTAISPDVIDTLSWNFGDNSFSGTNIDTPLFHSYLTPGDYPVRLIVGTDKNCFDTLTQNVRVFPMPTPFYNQPESKCLKGNNYTFQSRSTAVSPSTIINHLWKIDRSFTNTLSGATVAYRFTSAGPHQVELVATSSDGCKDSIVQSFVVYPHPQTSFNLPPTLCFLNNNFLFTSTSTIAFGRIDRHYWDFGDNVLDTGNPVRHPFTNPSILNYQVQLITESDFGCRDTGRNNVSFLASPIVNLNPISNHNLCSGDNVTISATASMPSGSITSYQWTIGGTNIPGANTTSIQVQTSGVYQINVFGNNGCFNSSSAETMIVNPLPVGNINIPTDFFICEGGTNNISCTPISNTIGYQWHLDGVPISGATQSSYSATEAGIYSVQLISQNNCRNFAGGSAALVLRKRPEAHFTYPTYCKQIPVLFNNSSNISESGAVSWIWNFGDASISTSYEPAHTYPSAGTYSVTLTATSIDCPTLTDTYQKNISITDPIPGKRYLNINATKNQNQTLSCRDLGNGILWLPSRGINNPAIANPVFNYDATMEYIIRLKNISGCLTYDTLAVRVFDQVDIQVPSAFSPNSDGHNDYMDIFPIGISKFISLKVYNRWGKLMYETTDPQKKWDGTYLGKKQPSETYVWIAEAKDALNNPVVKRGQILLLR